MSNNIQYPQSQGLPSDQQNMYPHTQQHVVSSSQPPMMAYYTPNNNMYPTLGYAQYSPNVGYAVPMPVSQPQPIPVMEAAQNSNNDIETPLQTVELNQGSNSCCITRGGCFAGWRRCREQHRFIKSLTSKSVSCIPKGVLFALGFIFLLTIAFCLTIGSSIDKKRRYSEAQCQIVTDAQNLVVHFDYDRDLYYVNLKVSVSGNNGGGHHHGPRDTNEQDANNERMSIIKPQNSLVLREVCGSSLLQKTSDCRDRVIAQAKLTCMVSNGKSGCGGHGHRGNEAETPGMEHTMTREAHPFNHNNMEESQGEQRYQQFGASQVKTKEEVYQEYRKSIRCSGIVFAVLAFIAVVILSVIARRCRKVKPTVELDNYKLDEVSESAIVIQDPNETKNNCLLSASTLQMENLSPCKAKKQEKRMKMFTSAISQTATQPQETLLFYELLARSNMCCSQSACTGRGKMIAKKIARGLLCVFFILVIVGLVTMGAFNFASRAAFAGIFKLEVALALIFLGVGAALLRRRKVHYYITNQRLLRVVELPFRLCLAVKSVEFEKITKVWSEGNKIHITVAGKDSEKSGIIFTHVTDPAFIVNLVQQRLPTQETTAQE